MIKLCNAWATHPILSARRQVVSFHDISAVVGNVDDLALMQIEHFQRFFHLCFNIFTSMSSFEDRCSEIEVFQLVVVGVEVGGEGDIGPVSDTDGKIIRLMWRSWKY